MKEFYKKYKKVCLSVLICFIVLVIGIIAYNILVNENALTIDEKTWIDENVSSVLNINIINDANIFGDNAEGVYYDFLNDFSEQYNLTINPITYKYESSVSDLTLGVFTSVDEDDVIFYTDHYVLVSKSYEIINSYDDFQGTIGVISSDSNSINSVCDNEFITYESESSLMSAFASGEVDYIIVPRYLYADYILSNDYFVIYHLSDAIYYYALSTDDSELSSILTKYFNNTWSKEVYSSFKENEFSLYIDNLGLTESEVDKISSVDYTYGFVENSPYEIISSGNFGGVSAVLLSEFSDFSNAEFEYVKYKNYDSLVEAINSEEIDIYLDKYNLDSSYDTTTSGYNSSFYVIAKMDNTEVVNSITGLSGKIVYVEANTNIYDYLSEYSEINLQTYTSESELSKLNKEDVFIVIDSNSYEFYIDSMLDNYTLRYSFETNFNSSYAVSTDDVLFELLNNYINIADNDQIIIEGINNYYETISFGQLISSLAKYILLFTIVLLLIIVIFIRKSKRIQLARKIKKEDKLKYIDQLTSLKNRNYLNDSKESWDNNTIYPQTVIIIDLNKVQKINDQFGYKEGDKQIKAFANALIKTQLDNTEVMRTDGNEFVVYLVGYSQKQIVNYIHKLSKEVDKLPYKDGAKFGYSMINDNLKTVEDALNEAANDMLEKNKNE